MRIVGVRYTKPTGISKVIARIRKEEGWNDKQFASPVRIKLSDWLDNDMIGRTMIDLLNMGYINSLPQPLNRRRFRLTGTEGLGRLRPNK